MEQQNDNSIKPVLCVVFYHEFKIQNNENNKRIKNNFEISSTRNK